MFLKVVQLVILSICYEFLVDFDIFVTLKNNILIDLFIKILTFCGI